MLALAHHYDELVAAPEGAYRARVYGEVQEDGMWAGRIVFFPAAGGRVIATDRETTQSSLSDLRYWASGLTHQYLHGALDRALDLQPEAQLARELDRLERLEVAAEARAETLESAASIARAESRLAQGARDATEERLLEAIATGAEQDAAAHEQAAKHARIQAEAADHVRKKATKTKTRTERKRKHKT